MGCIDCRWSKRVDGEFTCTNEDAVEEYGLPTDYDYECDEFEERDK